MGLDILFAITVLSIISFKCLGYLYQLINAKIKDRHKYIGTEDEIDKQNQQKCEPLHSIKQYMPDKQKQSQKVQSQRQIKKNNQQQNKNENSSNSLIIMPQKNISYSQKRPSKIHEPTIQSTAISSADQRLTRSNKKETSAKQQISHNQQKLNSKRIDQRQQIKYDSMLTKNYEPSQYLTTASTNILLNEQRSTLQSDRSTSNYDKQDLKKAKVTINQLVMKLKKLQREKQQIYKKNTQLKDNLSQLTIQNRQNKQYISKIQAKYSIQLANARTDNPNMTQQLYLMNKQQKTEQYKQKQQLFKRQDLIEENKNLSYQLQFCRQQLEKFYQSDRELRKKLQKMNSQGRSEDRKHQNDGVPYFNMSKQENNHLHNSNNNLNDEKPIKIVSSIQLYSKNSPVSKYSNKISQPNSIGHSRQSQKISDRPNKSRAKYLSTQKIPPSIKQTNFLSECKFMTTNHRQYIYRILQTLHASNLQTEKLYESHSNYLNPHIVVDDIPSILFILHLKNGKILAAFSQQSFSSKHPQSTFNNIAIIFDISNFKYFSCQSGSNSITYSQTSFIWGYNEIMLKVDEPDMLYTNFGHKHNLYWDGKHQIKDFIGQDRQWAKLQKYQVFKVIKNNHRRLIKQ